MSESAAGTFTKPIPPRKATEEAPLTRLLLIAISVAFLGLFLLLPLAVVFTEALQRGLGAFLKAFTEPEAQDSIRLTVTVAAIVVPANVVFGLAAAWAVAKFSFKAKSLLIALIELPFSVSPVVVGLVYVLAFGAHGPLGRWLADRGVQIIFATPGIVLVTIFVTFPFVARELIPLMQEQGTVAEEAALTLGASGFKTFLTVTLPNIKWGLLYGVLLCSARAIGEFGAVSVVSGHIRGLTNTIPLHVEALYNDYHTVAAFSLASLPAGLALVTLCLKTVLEWRRADAVAARRRQRRTAARV